MVLAFFGIGIVLPTFFCVMGHPLMRLLTCIRLYGIIFNIEPTGCQCPVGFKRYEQGSAPGNDVTRKHASTVRAQQC